MLNVMEKPDLICVNVQMLDEDAQTRQEKLEKRKEETIFQEDPPKETYDGDTRNQVTFGGATHILYMP